MKQQNKSERGVPPWLQQNVPDEIQVFLGQAGSEMVPLVAKRM